LLLGRLVLGSAESLVGSGSIGWGIGRVGAANTAKVISWNGIASYGALAVGAPLGVLLVKQMGLWSMGVSIVLLAVLGLLLAWPKTAAPIVVGERLPFMHVLGRVLPHGCGLALGSIGFGTIATFITLYYATQHWDNAVLCLSLFGASFIGARLLFGNLINRLGGFRVAIACLSVETLGLLLLWLAPDAHWALAGAALSGFGFSLVFPALGVEAVNLVPASSRGAAVGAYSLFIDLSLGITGPLAGAVAAGFGFASIFLFAALAAVSGLALSLYLYRQAPKQRQARDSRYKSTLPRPALMLPRLLLDSSRRVFEPRVGLVGLRFFSTLVALWINSTRRSSASARFCSWVRYCWALMINTPSLVMRLSRSANSRSL